MSNEKKKKKERKMAGEYSDSIKKNEKFLTTDHTNRNWEGYICIRLSTPTETIRRSILLRRIIDDYE